MAQHVHRHCKYGFVLPICLEFRNSNQTESLVSHEIPDYPWQNVAKDLFSLRGQDYIVVVEYFSRYFEFERHHNMNSTTVIGKLRGIYSRFGIPAKKVSDNGPSTPLMNLTHLPNSGILITLLSAQGIHSLMLLPKRPCKPLSVS